ncbi:uncharacterized protein LOC134340309 [Mobula hypostoma]|uniref:uncharacterized protein LOC134340309 n=1 Tax=Mobula hypostoma TaxID=723540 RepID=UPI002FC3E02F
MLLDTEMANKMYLQSKIGEKDSEASSKKVDVIVMAPLHTAQPGPVLSDDLERPCLVLITDMTQAVHSALKRELEDALSPVNATMEQIMSSYESHDERIREVEDGLNDYSDRLVSTEATIAVLQSENAFLKGKLDDLENQSRRSNLRVVGIPENLEGSDPVKFMTEFFDKVLGTSFFSQGLSYFRVLTESDVNHPVSLEPSKRDQERSWFSFTSFKISNASSIDGSRSCISADITCFFMKVLVRSWGKNEQLSRR